MLNFTVLCGLHARARSQQSRKAALRAAKSGLLTHRRAGEREKHAAHLRYVTVLSGSHARVRSQQSRKAALRAARPDSTNAREAGWLPARLFVAASPGARKRARRPSPIRTPSALIIHTCPALAPPTRALCIGALHPMARVMPRAALPPRCTASPAERALPTRAQSLECGLAHSAAM